MYLYLELGLEGEHQYLNASLALQLCTTWLNRSLEKGKTFEGLIFFYFFSVVSFFNILLINNNIIGWGLVKYCDLSVVSRSIFAKAEERLRDTDKSWYFSINEFNNCFIIRSPSLNIVRKWRDLLFLRKSDCKKEKSIVSFMNEQNIISSQTELVGQHCAWADCYL